MVFASKRSPADEAATEKLDRRSPLSAILGRRAAEVEELPAVDIAAGLNRILRTTLQPGDAEKRPDIEPVRHALACIEAGLYAIDTVRDIIEQAYEVALSAQDVEDVGGRALLAESYDELRLSINATIDALDERAGALLGRNQRNLDVKLGGKAHYSISPTRLDLTAKGLNLDPPRDAFATFDEINSVLSELDNALKKADRAAAGYCRDAQFLMARINAHSGE